jgi:hypothetical protein
MRTDNSTSALLDIGGDVGALVIYAGDDMVGEEIEICPSGDLVSRTHNVVRARRTPTGVVYAAVFPALFMGEYTLLSAELAPLRNFVVNGGFVSEIDFSTEACELQV